MKKNFLLLGLSMAALIGLVHAREERKNLLNNIFFHQGGRNARNDNSLELGKLVLYFSDSADFTMLPVSPIGANGGAGEMVEKRYLFPHTIVAAHQSLEAAERVGRTGHEWYSVQVAVVKKPIPGLLVTVRYNPEKVAVRDHLFSSIQLNRALEIVFFNKEVERRLFQRAQAPVLRHAFNQKKKYGVVIDCGHGGSDSGAIGQGLVHEKDVTLSIGLRVADLLQKKNLSVFLTRDKDETVPIDLRTSFANSLADKADLLVSIHANMAQNELASGIETYCLDDSLFFSLAAKSRDKEFFSWWQHYLSDRYKQSDALAQSVQKQVVLAAQKKNSTVNDRRVKRGVAQVLSGTQLPAALIEVGFLSNKREAALLVSDAYQEMVAQGISRGIVSYLKEQAI